MTVPARHGNYDLEALDENNVFVYCADPDCAEAIGVANVKTWGLLAEAHYKEKVAEVGT